MYINPFEIGIAAARWVCLAIAVMVAGSVAVVIWA